MKYRPTYGDKQRDKQKKAKVEDPPRQDAPADTAKEKSAAEPVDPKKPSTGKAQNAA